MYVVTGAQEGAISALTADLRRIPGITSLDDSRRTAQELDEDHSVGMAEAGLLCDVKAHQGLHASLPSTRFVLVFTNPVERVISSYFHRMGAGELPLEDPDIGLMRILRGYEQSPEFGELIRASRYSAGLGSLVEWFDRSQLHMVSFAEFRDKPIETVENIAGFLGVGLSDFWLKKLRGEPVPRRFTGPQSLEEAALERARRAQASSPPVPVPALAEYASYRERTSRAAGSPGVGAVTWLALWGELLHDALDLARDFPDTAGMVNEWLSDHTRLDRTLPVRINIGRRHPKKSSSAFSPPSEYCVGLLAGSSLNDLRPCGDALLGATETVAPESRFAADPCLAKVAGRTFVFYESGIAPNALIEVAEVVADRSMTPLGIALDEAFHVSYPQVFSVGSELWMTVESVAANALLLYRCVDFPLSWHRHAELAEGKFRDPSPFLWNGHLHLMATTERGLELFLVDLADGEATPHPASPLDIEPRFRRMGGGVFPLRDGLFRVSQYSRLDGRREYGVYVDLHRITRLTADAWEEEVEKSPFLPRRGVLNDEEWCQRIHHLNVMDDDEGLLAAIDGRDAVGLFSC